MTELPSLSQEDQRIARRDDIRAFLENIDFFVSVKGAVRLTRSSNLREQERQGIIVEYLERFDQRDFKHGIVEIYQALCEDRFFGQQERVADAMWYAVKKEKKERWSILQKNVSGSKEEEGDDDEEEVTPTYSDWLETSAGQALLLILKQSILDEENVETFFGKVKQRTRSLVASERTDVVHDVFQELIFEQVVRNWITFTTPRLMELGMRGDFVLPVLPLETVPPIKELQDRDKGYSLGAMNPVYNDPLNSSVSGGRSLRDFDLTDEVVERFFEIMDRDDRSKLLDEIRRAQKQRFPLCTLIDVSEGLKYDEPDEDVDGSDIDEEIFLTRTITDMVGAVHEQYPEYTYAGLSTLLAHAKYFYESRTEAHDELDVDAWGSCLLADPPTMLQMPSLYLMPDRKVMLDIVDLQDDRSCALLLIRKEE